MTSLLFFKCFWMGMLGILFHIFVIKLPALKKRSAVANIPFSLKCYFQDDWIALGSSVIALIIALMGVDEIIKYKPVVGEFVKWFFVFVGFTGSSTLQALLSKTDTTINKIVDIKTNIADGIVKPENIKV